MSSSLVGRCRWNNLEYGFNYVLVAAPPGNFKKGCPLSNWASWQVPGGGDCRVGTEGHWIDLIFSKGKTLMNLKSVWDNIFQVLLLKFVDIGSHSMWSNKFSWEISRCDSISSYVYCDDHCVMIRTLFSWHTIAPDQTLQFSLEHWSRNLSFLNSCKKFELCRSVYCNC